MMITLTQIMTQTINPNKSYSIHFPDYSYLQPEYLNLNTQRLTYDILQDAITKLNQLLSLPLSSRPGAVMILQVHLLCNGDHMPESRYPYTPVSPLLMIRKDQMNRKDPDLQIWSKDVIFYNEMLIRYYQEQFDWVDSDGTYDDSDIRDFYILNYYISFTIVSPEDLVEDKGAHYHLLKISISISMTLI